jgi:predicted Zn-dependent protease
MLGAILIAAMVPGAGQAAIAAVTAAGMQYQINFTRANEYEADRIGIDLLAGSGFDPNAMPAFFQRMDEINRYNDPAHVPEYLRTHPVTTSRIAESRSRAEKYPRRGRGDTLAYLLAWTKIKVASFQEPTQAARFFKGMMREGDYRNEDVARYGYALALTSAAQYEEARIQISHLLKGEREIPTYLLAAGRMELGAGNKAKALKYFERAYRIYHDDRAVLISYAEALLAADQPEKVRTLLKEFVYSHRPDLRYYKVLAEAEGRAGSVAEARLLLAEYHFRSGDLKGSILQLKLASSLPNLDYYQRQRIEARLDELQKILHDIEQKKFFKF